MEILARVYDVGLFDLDGVLYSGSDPVDHAANSVAAARRHGMRTVFVTNNASRTPDQIAGLLRDVGVTASPGQVATSAQAAARVLADRLEPGSRVLVCGSPALAAEVAGAGLTPVTSADDDPAAAVQGYDAGIGWRELAETTVAVRRGALWVATNTDLTLPSPRGPVPGNGTLVQVVASATGRKPLVAGKPEPALHEESLRRADARRPLVVGDRLETDIEGASRVGCDSLLVLTGVTDGPQLLAARPDHRPTHIAADLRGLLAGVRRPLRHVAGGAARAAGESGPEPAAERLRWELGGWTARVGSELELAGSGDDPIDALRVLCAAAWAQARGSSGAPTAVRADNPAGAAALIAVGLG